MELTGNEPISAANLAAVLAGAGLGREVLLASPVTVGRNNSVSGMTGITFHGAAGRFSRLEVDSPEGAAECPVPGTVSFGVLNLSSVTASESRGDLELSFESNNGSGQTVTRIVGVGGGQLLADILAALEGVA